MGLGRFYDDLVTKAVEFNLAIVNRVYINNNDIPNQNEEKNSSQIVEIKPLNTTLPTVQKKIKARPLFRGISDSITRGDLVLFALISKKIYYIGPLNTFNNPNHSHANFYSTQLEGKELNNQANINHQTGYGKEYPQISSVKKLQKRRNKTLDLLSDAGYEASKHSDLIIEGRHGNGIRIGSKSIFPILNISNNNSSVMESLSRGSLISLMSNGSLEQNFNLNAGFLLSTDIPTDKTNDFKLNLGNDDTEDYFDYGYGDINNPGSYDQIIISSDRITLDARNPLGGDFTVSANRNINFGATKNFTLNNKGFSVINSGNIYIGKEAKNKAQPMVLGDELRILLLDIMTILQNSRALVQGVPIPLVDQNSAPMFDKIQTIIESLQPRTLSGDPELPQPGNTKFLSQYHYVEQNVRPKPTQE